jgi:hypothetical protein
MAILNITYRGRSADVAEPIAEGIGDADIRRIAVELVRTGGLDGLYLPDLPRDAFRYFVVDRLVDPHGVRRVYLRPKVPFGERG